MNKTGVSTGTLGASDPDSILDAMGTAADNEVDPNRLATGTAVQADMSEVAVVRDAAPSVTLLSERYAEFDQQAIRVVTRYALGLLHSEGVVVLTASTT